MKRLISVVLLLAMIFCCAACGGNQEFSNSTTGTENSPSSEISSGKKEEQNTESTTDSFIPSKEYDNVYPQHEPYGTGVGAMPGRVVWAYDSDSVEWNGKGYWWELDHFDESVILNMVNDSIAAFGGKDTAQDGWAALFTANNSARGKSGGYKAGEKIRSAYRDRTDYSLIEQCVNVVNSALGEVREKESIAEKFTRSKEENGRGDYKYREEER